jgi:dTDP-glucose 4,6-dehydratase
LPTDDPKVRQPDITLAKDILGWQPEVALTDGLRRTIEQAGADVLVGSAR